ncbi:glycosyltransferase family 2 protein [Microbacterium sediminicola]
MREWYLANGRPFSIVIPSYNDIPLLSEAMSSIERTCAGMDYEVIIVDDYIDSDVQQALRGFESDRVRVVLKDERRGFAGTVNVGMQLARHDIILLNSDVVAQPGWLEALQYSAYAVDAGIGMVSPKLVYPDGRIQYAGTYYARLLAPQWFGHLHVGSPATRPTANVPGYNGSISGACVYITRAAYDSVGLLDDEFWLGFEDVDYGLRAWRAGVRCYYQPAAMLVHHESASRGYSQGHRELASMRRFWRRWEDRLLARKVAQDAAVEFLVGEGSNGLWRTYVRELAARLASTGREVRVLSPGASTRGRSGIVVACDWTVAEEAWLCAAEGDAVPLYLLPSVESIAHPTDPALQSRIVAGYRPEFDYIAPNRAVQRQLQAETAWECRSRIAPAIAPEALPSSSARTIVTVGASAAEAARIRQVAGEVGANVKAVESVESYDDIARIRAHSPRVVVSFLAEHNSLRPYALMSIGATYLSPIDPALSHEVLDGYNALLFARGDLDAMARSLTDALTRDDVHDEVRGNGWASAQRAADTASSLIVHALALTADSPV